MQTESQQTDRQKKTGKSNASKQNSGLNELFESQLQDIYWAEKALVKSLPKFIKNATSKELIDALESHLSETEEQVVRLEEAFASIDSKAKAKRCESMAGLLLEAEQIIGETEKGLVRDAGIILAAQKIEHYEIATYGTLSALADTLGYDDVADLMEETLNEEKNADQTLNDIAVSHVNKGALELQESEY